MGVVLDLGILGVPPSLIDHVKLEAGDGIELEYDQSHNSIVIAATPPPKANPGELLSSIIGTLDFDGVIGEFPVLLNVSGNIYAVVYRGVDAHGWIKTVQINDDGSFEPDVIDAFEFDTSPIGSFHDFIKVGPERFAIAYKKDGDKGYLITFAIMNDGTIATGIISIMLLDAFHADTFSLLQISEDVFAVAYQGLDNHGWLRTYRINDQGSITEEIDGFWFDHDYAYNPRLIWAHSDYYAISYTGLGVDGKLLVLEIRPDGGIPLQSPSEYIFDSAYGYQPKVIKVTDNTYAIAYTCPNNDGCLITMTINDEGRIVPSIIDSFEFEPTQGWNPWIAYRAEDVYALAFRGPGNDGWLYSVRIADDGTITTPVVDSLEFNVTDTHYCRMLQIKGDVFAIAFANVAVAGTLTTVGIDP